jgi:hypothetical protein
MFRRISFVLGLAVLLIVSCVSIETSRYDLEVPALEGDAVRMNSAPWNKKRDRQTGLVGR